MPESPSSFDRPTLYALASIGAFMAVLVVWCAAIGMWTLAGAQGALLAGLGLQVWGQQREARGAGGRRLRLAGMAVLAVLALVAFASLAQRAWTFVNS